MIRSGGGDDLAAARRAVLRDPRSADAQAALARARASLGLARQAVEAFAASVRLRPDDPGLWVALGAARYEAGDAEGAQAAMRRVLAAAPGHAAASAHLAGFLRADGDGEGAEALLRAALDADPGAVPARLELADGLLQDEKHAEVLALLDGEPPDDPLQAALWRAHRALALLRSGERAEAGALLERDPPAGARLVTAWRRVLAAGPDGDRALAAAAAALLNAPDEPHEQRVTAHFNLARFWSARGDKAAAFALWTQGHRLMQAHQPFRRESFAGFADASIAAFDAARLRRGPRARDADPAPVFVVGMPRSGTTLCEQILAGHRSIHGAGERTALAATFQRLGGARESAEAARRVAALDADSLDAAAGAYLRDLRALAPEARRIVDKMPGNFRLLGLASLMLPGARVIHCVRDPRDVGFSIFSRRFMGHHPYAHDLRDLGFYIGRHHLLMAHWAEASPLPILRVHLHDWIRDLKGTLARVLDFLDLPYDAECERFHESGREVRTASRDQVRRPVNRLGLGRWRDYADELTPLTDELRKAGLLPTFTRMS